MAVAGLVNFVSNNLRDDSNVVKNFLAFRKQTFVFEKGATVITKVVIIFGSDTFDVF